MNHIYRLVWNQITNTWVCCAENVKGRSKPGSARVAVSRSSWGDVAKTGICKRVFALTSLSAALAFAGVASAANLPTGGNIVAGAGTISQSGNVMTITQGTARMAADWQSFSIGQGSTVNFVQPSASSVALNRVLGADVSVIQGALHANGQVFLINPNGVLFNQTAQVNVGGITASTLNISNADFMAGNYKFSGASSNAIVNQGNITAANGGTIALIAAKITNDGNLTANGGNVLLGAGSKVTLDLGGPVKLLVESAAIDALIQNGGAIKADGGTVMLTSHAAGDLIATVINNTGVIEAQTLATGEKGQIFLLGDMVNDRIVVGGTLDASAPNGGDGGFIETSAANVKIQDGIQVTAASSSGKGGKWLIDPTDITISAASCTGTNCISANTIASTLNSGTDVSIATSATNTGVERGDINVNANMTWSQSILTLTAHNDIWLRGNLTGTGTAKLALEYGQASLCCNSMISTYTILGSLSLPANSFAAQNRTSGNPTWMNVPTYLNNGSLRFGDGTTSSVDQYGSLLQPFYYNATDARWYQLTYSTSPMYLNIGYGGTGFSDGTIISNQGPNQGGMYTANGFDGSSYVLSPSLNVSGFSNGVGTLVATNTLNDGNGVTMTIKNTYTLLAGKQYVEATTELTNTSGSTVNNARLWSGTRDDFIGTTDGPLKQKGNIVNGVFVPVMATGQAASVVQVTNNNEGILFYSTSTGADTTVGSCCSPDFHIDSAGTGNPLVSPQDTPFNSQPLVNNYSTDGNYSVYSNFGNLANNASKSIVWYYAAGDLASLTTVVSSVAQAAVAALAPPAPAPVNNIPLLAAVAHVETGAHHSVSALRGEPVRLSAILPQPSVQLGIVNNAPVTIGSLDVVSISTGRGERSGPVQGAATPMNSEGAANADRGATDSGTADSQIATQISEQRSLSAEARIFVVDGGINLAVNNEGESR